MIFDMARVVIALLLSLLVALARGQSTVQEQIKNLDAQIGHYQQAEQRIARLLEGLHNLSIVITRGTTPTPLRVQDIRDQYAYNEVVQELKQAKPDLEAALKRAGQKADKFIYSNRSVSDQYKNELVADLSKIRTSRQKAQTMRERLRLQDLADQIGTDLVGSWQVRITTPFSWYEYRWDITGGGGNWKVEQTLLDTDHGFHRSKIGEKFHSYTLKKTAKGIEVFGSETDANPGNPGSFTQTGLLKVSKDAISGEGEHKGTRLTHWIKFSGSRMKKI